MPLSRPGPRLRLHGATPRHACPDPIAVPRLPEEEQLARIFCEVLGLERVGVHDRFFDLGGQSVHGAAVVMRARQIFRVELPMRALFETPTIAELAVTIAKLQATASPVRP